MAVIETNKQTKVKLTQLTEQADGSQKKSSRSYSNIKATATSEAIMTGMNAVIGLLATAPASVSRIDEVELVTE